MRKSSRKLPWKRKRPKQKRVKLSARDKQAAKRRAKRGGRHYPNLVDNMAVTRKKKRKKKRG